jgi:hypothetical protein
MRSHHLTILLVGLLFVETARAVPLFSRRYNLSCQSCHVVPAKLNSFGEEFVARGYEWPAPIPTYSTVPTAIWMSGLGQRQPGKDFVRGFFNRIEFISSGVIAESDVSYFVEWRAWSMELQSDGRFRDRSGRFEDLFFSAALTEALTVTVGQFRVLNQVDVSRRLSVSEPLVFSSALAGYSSSSPRISSLRAFSPAGRSPAVSAQYYVPLFGSARRSDGWFSLVTLPMTGEISIPLTQDARRNASFEFEAKPKGVFLESFLRRGMSSIGAHFFSGNNRRLLAQLVASTSWNKFYGTGSIGAAKVQSRKLTNMMAEIEYIPSHWFMAAARVEHQVGSGRRPAIVPYAVIHYPGTSYTIRLALEQRIQENNNQFSIETSLIF